MTLTMIYKKFVNDSSVPGNNCNFEAKFSEDQHGVAKGKKTISRLDRLLVGIEDQVPAGEGTDQHHEGGFGQVKVGHQRIHSLESIAWQDE